MRIQRHAVGGTYRSHVCLPSLTTTQSLSQLVPRLVFAASPIEIKDLVAFVRLELDTEAISRLGRQDGAADTASIDYRAEEESVRFRVVFILQTLINCQSTRRVRAECVQRTLRPVRLTGP